jgi:prepilin-type N-terminal cleavage/methylation domain-containing protein/prepilin-type processing-associated H-X9-DG protein
MTVSARTKVTGFSLIELLVVIAIIGTIIGITLPAVMKVRARAASLQCQHNLRQLGLAFQNYTSVNGGFPPSVSYSLGWKNGMPTGTVHLWSVYLLPFLDQQPLVNIYDFNVAFFDNATAIATPLRVLQCPSAPMPDRTTTVANWVPSTAFGIAGFAAYDPFLSKLSVTMAAGDYATYPKVADDWKVYLNYPAVGPDLVGVLMEPPLPSSEATTALLAGGSIPLAEKSTAPSEVTDGLSNTILVIEDGGRPQLWVAGTLASASDMMHGAGWADPGAFLYLQGDINAACLINCNNNASIYSFHVGGGNFAFADGSTRFLSSSTSLPTIVALLTAKSGDFPGGDW